MKMHFLDGDLVYLRFGLTQLLEHGDGGSLCPLAEFRLLNHLHDVRKMAVGVRFLHLHVVLGGADAAALHLFERNHRAGFERVHGIANGGLVRAGIRQSAHQHVAADSRECVQIAGKGHDPLL